MPDNKEYCRRHEVEILAYCLMTNHIHLVAVPARDDALQCALKPLHMRYAQHINRQRKWSGHLALGRRAAQSPKEPALRV